MVNYQPDYQSNDAVFQALSDPTRRVMIERLARRSMPVTELAEPFRISAPAVSKHVRTLEAAGLLRREVQGRQHICHLRGDRLEPALEWLERQRRFWEQSLDNLERLFQNQEDRKDAER